ncbi:SusC/RagA family TonB-linked outer membrane protein [Bacteroides ihuae]|uniref:SusC/RagA family TonB-linked outer membrane protein n=1 Tax=Bacteroides ihuae TaxID=1852362 RepID=UPI0008DA9B80|nr:TonB-dependent receptor [Bacteroides ihuae]
MKKNKRKLLPGYSKIFFALLVLFLSLSAFAQKITVTGQVTDSQNQSIIGGSVLEKGTTNGVITDLDGNFSLSVANGATLVISYVGYKPQEVKATAHMKIVLKEDNELLDEVVVIGYGSVKRKDVTTSISSVSTKDLDQRPIISAGQAIQGKAAGISVMQPSGEPGSGLSIRVRGTTSYNGSNDPLYVVDGVPMTDINYLSANDIESMQILKDASSAAIYGSRAANGVIMITTKQGAKGVAKIALNAHVGVTQVNNKIKSLNMAQYRELMDEIGIVHLPDGLKDETNWFDETYRTGVTQNYQVSVSNGNEKWKYFLSGGYTDESGVIKTAFYKRYNFRANIENQVRSWLNVSANVAYSDYTSNGIISGQGSNRGGVVLSVINTPTYGKIWDDANPGQYYNNFYGVNITHPLENMARSENNKNNTNRLIATGKAEITFLPELKLKSTFTLDREYNNTTNFLDPLKTSWGRNQHGEGKDERSQNSILVFDNILTYNKSVKKHNFDVMVGSSWTGSKWSQSYINGSNYLNGAIQTLNAANNIAWDNTGTKGSEWSIMSYVGRLAYNYDSKYLITANMRADGSSKLHPSQRWGYFPSVSAAWRISSEEFMKEFTWINDLKLRGGWGQTGNQSALGDYSYFMRYDIHRVQWWETGNEQAVPTLKQANLRTLDLTWETTSQTNVGIDFTVLNSRLTFYLDYYYKRTSDMLMKTSIPEGQSSDNIIRNGAKMINKGFEVTVNSRNLTGKFSWDTDFNISFNKNKLTSLLLTKIYNDAVTSDALHQYVVRNEVGQPLGSFYGYISDGVNPETGELMYRDITDDGIVSTSDRTYIGDPNPDFTFGLTNSFSWKGFSLSVFLQGSYGNDIYNASRMDTEGMYDGLNQSTRVLNRWRIPGQITDVPKAGFNMQNSSYFVENGSYLRVKDVSLSYNFTDKLLKKWGISRLQPYFTANNLITWTDYSGMDPEVNQWANSGAVQGIDWGTYPQSKSFVFGLNVEF